MMQSSYEIFLALRYLRAERSAAAITLVNIFSFLGVFIGVAALIVTLALMTGFHTELRNGILGANSHLIIFDQFRQPIQSAEQLRTDLLHVENVEAAAPFIYRKIFLSHGEAGDGMIVKGIDPMTSGSVIDVGSQMIEGELGDLRSYFGEQARILNLGPDERPARFFPGIILGRELASSLRAGVGDRVRLFSPENVSTPAGSYPKNLTLEVVGIFASGNYEYDSSWGYIHIEEAQDFFGFGDGVMGIELRLFDLNAAERTAAAIQERFGGRYLTRTWMDMNGQLFAALQLEKLVGFLFVLIIVLVASFGMTSSLTLLVMEKRREIGILKAMGAKRQSILLVFIIIGLGIGVAGTLSGFAVGAAVCWVLDTYELIQLPGEVYIITHVPFTMKVTDFLWTGTASVLVSLQATLYPALFAASLKPVDALRGE